MQPSSSPLISDSRKFIVDPGKPTVDFTGDITNISQKVKFNNKDYIITVSVKGHLDDAGVQHALNDAIAKTKTLAKAFNIGSDESHITSFTIKGNGELLINKDNHLLSGEDAKREALSRLKMEKKLYINKIATKPGTDEKRTKREAKIKNLKQIKDLISKGIQPHRPNHADISIAPAPKRAPPTKKSALEADTDLQELAKKSGEEFTNELNRIKIETLDTYAKLVAKNKLSPQENKAKAALEEKLFYLENLEPEENPTIDL
jgi:hypothetical protein